MWPWMPRGEARLRTLLTPVAFVSAPWLLSKMHLTRVLLLPLCCVALPVLVALIQCRMHSPQCA